ncbi:acyltransferase family protein [Sphingoaurantiacus capsulatus]|uniref:Acyltransferase family protein n=1 Tax=Sphingoaurantiacus capsulatus TaxID=1771310 RepID=A0ABV7X7U8_9SPHN
MERHYGLDWLRIGAFGLLIFYHIGMFFVPWDWHVKTAEPMDWVQIPMLATNAWRLALLFLVSGVASRFLLDKMAAPGRFAWQRSGRLLIPLAAGIILFVAPQPWAEMQAKFGYRQDFWHFWTHDYFTFRMVGDGIALPTYNHLWFVAYLWLYTIVLALFAALLPAGAKAALQRGFERLFSGARLLWLPILLLWLARVTLYPIFGDTHALVDDWYNHVVYGGLFLFGVGLAKSEAPWRAIAALWKPAALFAVVGYFAIVAYELYYGDGDATEPGLTLVRLLRAAHMWGAIVGLLALAQLRLNRDAPIRRYLTEAVFPYYIAHQTIIVVVGHALTPYRLNPGTEFAIILAATVAGCWATYAVARRVPMLGLLLGLKWKGSAAKPAAAAD